MARQIQLNPTHPVGYNNRGVAYGGTGDYDRAIQDFDQVIRLKSTDISVFNNRGISKFCLAHYEDAQRDFTEAMRLRPDALYSILWLYLAQARANDKKHPDFTISVPAANLKNRPGASRRAVSRNQRAGSSLVGGTKLQPKDRKDHICEAYFFLAEHALILGNRTEAMHLFQQAVDTAAMQEVAYVTSRAELGRLTKPGGPGSGL